MENRKRIDLSPLIRVVSDESLLIDIVARIMPWFTAAIPAYFSRQAVLDHYGIDGWFSWVVVAIVELLGVSAIHTAVQFNHFNHSKGEKIDYKAPAGIAYGVSVIYLVVIVTLNIVLDITPRMDTAAIMELVGKALLSLLAAPSAVILAIRAQHASVVDENDVAGQLRSLQSKLAGSTRKVNALQEKVDELQDRLRSLPSLQQELQQRVDEVAKLSQSVAELETAVADRDKQILSMQRTGNNVEESLRFYDRLSPAVQQSLKFLNGEYETQAQAANGTVHKSTISRTVRTLVNGDGHE